MSTIDPTIHPLIPLSPLPFSPAGARTFPVIFTPTDHLVLGVPLIYIPFVIALSFPPRSHFFLYRFK